MTIALLGGFCTAVFGADFDSTVKQLRNVNSRSETAVLERDGADWRVTKLVTGLRAKTPLTAEDLKQIIELTGLEHLVIYADDILANEGWQGLASLTHLQHVDVYLRNITDTALKSLVNVPKLHLFFFQDTAAAEPALALLGDIPDLRRLSLLWVRNSDASLRHVATLKSLEELDVASNDKITDDGIVALRDLKELRSLALERIGPKGVAALSILPRLEALTVGYKPSDPDVLDLSGLVALKSLTIGTEYGNANAAVRFPEGLQHLGIGGWIEVAGKLNSGEPIPKNLTSVYLRLCGVKTSTGWVKRFDLGWLGLLPALRELEVAFDQAKHDEIGDITGLEKLQSLTLTSQCRAFDDDDITRLAEMRQLAALTIEAGSSTTAIGMKALGGMVNLRRLVLKRFLMTTSGLANIWKLTKLEVLGLDVPQGTLDASQEKAMAGIASLSELKELSLTGTMTDAALKNLAALKKLRRLDLSGSQGFTDAGLAELVKALPELKTLVWSCSPGQKP